MDHRSSSGGSYILFVCLLFLCASLCTLTPASAGQYVNSQGRKLQVVSSTIAGYESAGMAAGIQQTVVGGAPYIDGTVYDTARFYQPRHIAYNSKRNLVYVFDAAFKLGALRVIDLAKGTVRTVCGQAGNNKLLVKSGMCGMDGTTGTGVMGVYQRFDFIPYPVYDASRDVFYLVDVGDGSIQRLNMSTYDGKNSGPTVTVITAPSSNVTICPSPIVPGSSFSMPYTNATKLCRPNSITIDEKQNVLYIADSVFGGIIQINLASNIVSSVLTGPIGSIQPADVSRVFYRASSNSLLIGTPDSESRPLDALKCFLVQLATYDLDTKVTMDYPSVTMAQIGKETPTPGCMYYYTQGPTDNTVLYHQQTGGQLVMLDFTNNQPTILDAQYLPFDFGPPESGADGPALSTSFGLKSVNGIYLDKSTNSLWISDTVFSRVTKLDMNTNTSKWIAGGGRTGGGWRNGGLGVGGLQRPYGLEWSAANNSVIFIDNYSNRARKVLLPSNTIVSMNGGGRNIPNYFPPVNHVGGCVGSDPTLVFGKVAPDGSNLYMGLQTRSVRIDPINPLNLIFPVGSCVAYLNATSSTVVNVNMTRVPSYTPGGKNGLTTDFTLSKDGQYMVTRRFTYSNGASINGIVSNVILRSRPTFPGSRLNWTDTILCGNNGTGVIADGACGRDGASGAARIGGGMLGLAVDDAAKRLYFTDANVVRYLYPYDSDTPSLYTLIGKVNNVNQSAIDGAASVATFGSLAFLVLGTLSGTPVMFLSDTLMHNIRMIDLTNVNQPIVYTIAGPTGIRTDAIVANTQWVDGQDDAIRFNQPNGLAFDGVNALYVADFYNNKIRKLTLTFPSTSSSSTGSPSSSSTSHSSSSTAVSSSSSTSTTSSTSTSSTGASSSTSTSSTTDSSTAASSSSSTAESSSSSSTVDSSSSAASSSSSSSSGSGSAISGESSSSSTGDSTGTIGASTQLTPHSFSSIIGVILVAALTYFHL